MGYDFSIGNAEIQYEKADSIEGGYFDSHIGFKVEVVRIKDVPGVWNVLTSQYGVWSNTMRETGLTDVFMLSGKPRGGHPGAFPITEELVIKVKQAVEMLKSKGAKPVEGKSQKDTALFQLEWVLWWSKWALKNCELPVFYNS